MDLLLPIKSPKNVLINCLDKICCKSF